MEYDVIVIGAGLAGSSAAIQLAEQGRRVLLLEKRTLPAHKLCGEFLSTEVSDSFRRLGVLDAVHAAGAHAIDRAVATTAGGASFESALPGTALGLSRYRLDELLVRRARAAGAEVRDGTTVRAVEGTLGEGFAVEADGSRFHGRLVLGAYGKRGRLDRTLERPFLKETTPFVAFKAHYEGADLPGRIELHAFPGGYCGLSHVEDGRINVCWIGHEDRLKAAGGTPEAMVEACLMRNDALADRLRSMQRVSEAFLAVSQVSLARKGTFAGGVCMIGDTAGMIAPLCGDGMGMALRAAELAVPQADAYLAGRIGAADFQAQYTKAWEADFALRLRLGRWIHYGSFQPGVAAAVVRACWLLPPLGRWLIRNTRG